MTTNVATLPPPPWSVAGTTVWLEKNAERKELRVLVPEGCMEKLADAELLELLTFTEAVRERFERVLKPMGWKVLA